MKTRILFIGVGNELRSDDGVGPMISRRLAEKQISNSIVIEMSGEIATLIEAWQNAEIVFLFDAISSDSDPGTIHRFNAIQTKIPTQFFRCSTHTFSVADAIELSRVLEMLPSRLIIYGIEGENFQIGSDLSPKISDAISEVIDRVLSEISQLSKDLR